MFETLRLIFVASAGCCGMLLLLSWKKKSCYSNRWLVATLILVALALITGFVNNQRISANRKSLESSSLVAAALEDITPVLVSENTYNHIHSDGQEIYKPYVLVPIEHVYNWEDRSKDSYKVTDGDSCWSGGLFVSAEQANQCKTILFYTTSVSEMPYKSTSGSITTGKSESKTVYVYDVDTRSLIDYKAFTTTLPNMTTGGTPNIKVSTQQILDWVKKEMEE